MGQFSSPDEQEIFCKVAKVINQKGHLEISAILKFIGSKNHKKDKKYILKFIKLALIEKHRSNTYELSRIGRLIACQDCEWFKKRYKK